MNTYEALYAMYFMEKPITLHSSLLILCSYIEGFVQPAPINDSSTKFKLHMKNMVAAVGCVGYMHNTTKEERNLTRETVDSLVVAQDWKRRFALLWEFSNNLTEIPNLKIYLDRPLTNLENLVVAEINSTSPKPIIEFVCIRK